MLAAAPLQTTRIELFRPAHRLSALQRLHDDVAVMALSIEKFPFGLRELVGAHFPILVELRQLIKPGRQRVRG